MATWTTIPDSSLEPGKPIRSIDALALRDNPVAIADGSIGAPRVVNQWFPYDYEAGGNGIIWDQSIDGSVASVTTPDFESGFDYILIATNISDNVPSNTNLLFEPYIVQTASYRSFTWLTMINIAGQTSAWGYAEISLPMLLNNVKSFFLTNQTSNSSIIDSSQSLSIQRTFSPSAISISKVRIRSSGGGLMDIGSIQMLKRKTNYREFV